MLTGSTVSSFNMIADDLFDDGLILTARRERLQAVHAWAFGAREAERLFHVQEFSNYLMVNESIEQFREANPLIPGDFCRLHGTYWIVTSVEGSDMICMLVLSPHTAMHTATMYVNRCAERVAFSPDTENRILRRMDRVLPESLRLPAFYPGQLLY